MYQQMNNNGQQYFGNGYAYAARPMPKCTQPVTAEMAKMLNQNSNDMDLRISNTDKIKNWCTHKEPGTGRMALVNNGDGTVTCRVCGETFRLIDDEPSKVDAYVRYIIDVMQTTKAMYLDIPEDFNNQYFQMRTLLEKLAKIYEHARKNFANYETYNGNMYGNNPGFNNFAAVNTLLGGFNPFGQGMGGYPMYPQQMPMQPQMAQQPQGTWATPPQGYPMYPQQPNYPMQQPGYPMSNNGMTAPTILYVDNNGNVMPGAPMGPTTMGGNPMPGMNPLVNTGMPMGNMAPPAPTGPATVPQTAPAAQVAAPAEPTQTKQMSV